MRVIAVSTCDVMDPLETRYKLIRAKLAGVTTNMLGVALKVLTERREMYIEHLKEGMKHAGMALVLTESIEAAENCIEAARGWRGALVVCGVAASSARRLSARAKDLNLYITAAGDTLQEIIEKASAIQAAGVKPAIAAESQSPMKVAALLREVGNRDLGLRISFPGACVKDTASEYDMVRQAALAMLYLRYGADVVVIEANFKWAIQPIARLICK
ncbi:MAG: hypothetical protein DRN96_01305 [Thermoproteota archaeon]|nr:MAG: hypothetical protein DRN96_01305 [Candidatus Korarchaeota archaeon]